MNQPFVWFELVSIGKSDFSSLPHVIFQILWNKKQFTHKLHKDDKNNMVQFIFNFKASCEKQQQYTWLV